MKAEYDLSTMKRRGHPLRDKVSRGEITLINPLDIPNREAKLGIPQKPKTPTKPSNTTQNMI